MTPDLDADADLDTLEWDLDGFADVLDLDVLVDLDTDAYGLNGEPLAATEVAYWAAGKLTGHWHAGTLTE
jgi:hypothetical protein